MHHSRNGFLTAKGLEEAAQRFSLEGLAPGGALEYVDRRVSVRASAPSRDTLWLEDELIEEQHRRFLNGF